MRAQRSAPATGAGTVAVRRVLLAAGLLLSAATALAAHDLFLKPETFFAAPNATVRVRVFNGTFTTSEGAVARARLRDLSVVSPEGVAHPDTAEWEASGDTSALTVRTGAAGTYVVGASVLPRELALKAEDFNKYLASDGVPDVLAARRRDNELTRPARERYSKHVKTMIQVGDARAGAFDTVLGYPAELVPLDNPYSVKPGGTLRVRALVDGRPVANQFVVSGGRGTRGARLAVRTTRTDADGVARVPLASRGQWYVKFIHMTRAQGDTTIDYESKWATLTFEVR